MDRRYGPAMVAQKFQTGHDNKPAALYLGESSGVLFGTKWLFHILAEGAQHTGFLSWSWGKKAPEHRRFFCREFELSSFSVFYFKAHWEKAASVLKYIPNPHSSTNNEKAKP